MKSTASAKAAAICRQSIPAPPVTEGAALVYVDAVLVCKLVTADMTALVSGRFEKCSELDTP